MNPFAIHHLIERAARTRPEAPAVIDGDRTWTYAQLDARANQLAHVLSDLGVRRGDRVGLYLDKSIEALVGVYGIAKAGAAYVPLDPGAPVDRLAQIVADAGLSVVVSDAPRAESWGPLVRAAACVRTLVSLTPTEVTVPVPVVTAAALDRQPTTAPPVAVIDQDLAYVLYTSGSTGVPKGVMLTHRNCLAFVSWAVEEFEVHAGDRVASHAPLHFDLSTFDLYAAAMAGSPVVLVPAHLSVFPVEVARFIAERRITVWYSVPSILTMLTLRGGLQPGALPSLRVVLFAGEVFPTPYLRQLMALVPDARFANLYGPTETNVCTWYPVPELDHDGPIPIGRPIANTEVFAVDDEGRRCATGEVGELWVRGATVMRGYWGLPERTAASLVADPFGTLGDPVYRTGDLVRQGPDGDWWYLGRRDAQIKSRGYRIELGDIEAALHTHPSIVECAAVAVPDELVTNRIHAYVVTRDALDTGELVRHLGGVLPTYMVPERIVVTPVLPRTSTGKIDRQAVGSFGPRSEETAS